MLTTSRRSPAEVEERSITVASNNLTYRTNCGKEIFRIRDLLDKFNWLEVSNDDNILFISDKRLGVETLETKNQVETWLEELNEPISLAEFYKVQAWFHLSMRDLPHPFELTDRQSRFNNPKKPFEYTGDPSWELDGMLRQDVQPVEKAVLASLFLDRDQIPTKFRYIHDLIHRTPIERFNRSYTLPDHWEIPLPDQTREVSSLGLEEGTATIEDLRTLRTRSYYHIQKDELMEKVRCLLCRGLRDEMIPLTYEDIEEMYERLLDIKGSIMHRYSSDQFPNDEVIFLWNRSMTSQSIEKAWYLRSTSTRIIDSIPNFTVTHHGNVKDGSKLTPTMDTEVWTNDQLRDALGYDWMFDPILTLEDNWMDSDRDIDFHIVSKIMKFARRVSLILPQDDNYQGGFLIKTNGDRLFTRSEEDLLNYMVKPEKNVNHIAREQHSIFSNSHRLDRTDSRRLRLNLFDKSEEPLRQDSDEQSHENEQDLTDLSTVEVNNGYCYFDGTVLHDFTLFNSNMFQTFDLKDFKNWQFNPSNSEILLNTTGLRGSYMLNLFFHQNRLDGLYSWYQDIYLANVRYLREYLRSVDLNEDYQLPGDVSELTLDDEWQLYMRNSNIFVDTFVRTFGNYSYPLVELNDPRATPNDLNNLKLLRLSLMQDMNYMCFLAQSHFLRSMVDFKFQSEPFLLIPKITKQILFNDKLFWTSVVNDVQFNSTKWVSIYPDLLSKIQAENTKLCYFTKIMIEEFPSLEDSKIRDFCRLCYKEDKDKYSRFFLHTSSIRYKNLQERYFEDEDEDEHGLLKREFSSQNLWLDYLTLTRFLQDDPNYEDELSWSNLTFESRDVITTIEETYIAALDSITSQEQLDRSMFQDTGCQVHHSSHPLRQKRIPRKATQNLLDQWYLSSENRKVNPNLHNRELRSLLPVFFMSQVLEDDEPDMNFLPTGVQLNDPVRFISSLTLANSFFDDYYSRKTWDDGDISMVEKILLELRDGDLSERLIQNLINYTREEGLKGIVDLFLLLNLTKDIHSCLETKDIYLRLTNCGVQVLNLKRDFFYVFNSLAKFEESNALYSYFSNNLKIMVHRVNSNWYGDPETEGFRILHQLRMVEQHMQDKSQRVRELTTFKAPFLRQSESVEREPKDVIDFKLSFLSDSIMENIFVRNNMLNRLSRTKGTERLEPSITLRRVTDMYEEDSFKDVTQEFLDEVLKEIKFLPIDIVGRDPDYLGLLLEGGVNFNFSKRGWRLSTRLHDDKYKAVNKFPILSKNTVRKIQQQYLTLINGMDDSEFRIRLRVWDAVNQRWVNPQVNLNKLGALISRERFTRSMKGRDIYGFVPYPIEKEQDREVDEDGKETEDDDEEKEWVDQRQFSDSGNFSNLSRQDSSFDLSTLLLNERMSLEIMEEGTTRIFEGQELSICL